jgi:predicted Zn-dependent peptidase
MRFESIGVGKPISFGTLPNGMRYYGRFDQVANAGGIGAKTGSAHDPPDKRGLAHLCEHMLSRSARIYSDQETNLILRRYLGSSDSDINVRIDRNSTFFGHLMLLRFSHMKKCFDLFAHLLKDRLTDQNGLDVERARILNEHRLRGLDLMEELAWDSLHEIAYTRNPARNRIDCVPEELEQIKLSDVKTFIRKHYVPRNMFMIVLGPRFKIAEKLAVEYFKDLPDVSAPAIDYDFTDGYSPLKESRIKLIERQGINQHHVIVGFPLEVFGGKNHYSFNVLDHILEQLLYNRLQEHNRGVYRSPVFVSRSKFHGLLGIHFATMHGDIVEQNIQTVLSICKDLRENLVDSGIFQAALHRAFYEYVGPFVNDANQLLELIIDSATNGDEDLALLHSGRLRLEKINRKTIMNLANQFLTPEYLAVHIKPV